MSEELDGFDCPVESPGERIALIQAELALREKEALEAIKGDICDWLSRILNINITCETFLDTLDTGVAVCKLATLIQKAAKEIEANGTTMKIKVPWKPLSCNFKAAPGTFFARDNTSNFINWCRKLGVEEAVIFESNGLVNHEDEKRVILCLLDVARFADCVGISPPELVRMEKEIEELEARELENAAQSSSPTNDGEKIMEQAPRVSEQKLSSIKSLQSTTADIEPSETNNTKSFSTDDLIPATITSQSMTCSTKSVEDRVPEVTLSQPLCFTQQPPTSAEPVVSVPCANSKSPIIPPKSPTSPPKSPTNHLKSPSEQESKSLPEISIQPSPLSVQELASNQTIDIQSTPGAEDSLPINSITVTTSQPIKRPPIEQSTAVSRPPAEQSLTNVKPTCMSKVTITTEIKSDTAESPIKDKHKLTTPPKSPLRRTRSTKIPLPSNSIAKPRPSDSPSHSRKLARSTSYKQTSQSTRGGGLQYLKRQRQEEGAEQESKRQRGESERSKVEMERKNETVDEKVMRRVNECTCSNKFQVTSCGNGKFIVQGSSGRKMTVYARLLSDRVMVRVGGGWDSLDHFLLKHDPCRIHAVTLAGKKTIKVTRSLSPQEFLRASHQE